MPRKIGKYEITQKIGEGGMAAVFKGVQPSLNRPVAIKVLSAKLSDRESLVKRFDRESLIVARLTHPNIIHVIDRGRTEDGLPYFVMDFIEGTDLEKVIKNNLLNHEQKMDVMVQTCKALSYAHKNGVVHRDIKPANILIDNDGNVMVADFGIAQLLDEHMTGAGLTREGAVMGTLSYMSPEQSASAAGLTGASDLYSLGVVMYELFAGTKPSGYFKMPSEMNPQVSKPLEDIILKCMAPDPADRAKTADEVRDILLDQLQGRHIQVSTRKAAVQGVTKEEDSLVLLDVIKEHKFGAVYLFRRKVSGKLMVVKKYDSPVGGLDEAKKFTSLSHENIVEIAGASGTANLYIVAMEYISGGSLEDRLIRPHDWKETLEIALGICNGLSFALENGIIHGNLRPSNIMITENGTVKIADFGLNEHYSGEKDETNWYNPFGEPKSPVTDIFSTGVILYRMLTGAAPVWSEGQLMTPRVFEDVPEQVRNLVRKMLSRAHEDNFGSIDDVIQAIEQIFSEDEKTMVLDFGSEEIQEQGEAQAPKKEMTLEQKRKRDVLRAILFLLFLETVIFYLFSTNQTEWLVSFWTGAAEDLMSALENFR